MKVKIQHPGLPDGYELSLTGLNAILLNNEEVEVDDEAIAQYENVTGKKFSETVALPAFGGEMPAEEKKDEEVVVENNGNDNENDNENAQTFTGHDGEGV